MRAVSSLVSLSALASSSAFVTPGAVYSQRGFQDMFATLLCVVYKRACIEEAFSAAYRIVESEL